MDKYLKLIIADDEPHIRSSLKQLFPWKQMGYEVISTFPNGLTALNYLEQHQADVLLTDIRMPIMDGLELIKTIQSHRLKVTPVILSAYSDFEYARQGLAYGAADFIVKPVICEELLDVFQTLKQKLLPSPNTPSKDTLSLLICYIENHLTHATLENASKSVNLSSDYVSRLFRKQKGISFSEYLLKARMDRAGQLIRNVNLQISDVAAQLGYNNAKNFSRAFHNYYGMTPSEYRRQNTDKERLRLLAQTWKGGESIIDVPDDHC